VRAVREGARVAALLLVAVLAGCGSLEGRLESANGLRHDGRPKEALAAYQAILAEMGDGPLKGNAAKVRARALKYAAEISYLELGDYPGAIAYYRRIVSLEPATPEAFEARGAIGDIYLERFHDPLAAIAQYADVAARDADVAPAFQLKVARGWMELRNWPRAREEARALRERWPSSKEADEAQLIAAQSWASEGRPEEALGAFRALVERRPSRELVARALEGQALLFAQEGIFDRALELYAQALPIHPNAEAVQTAMDAVARRRDAAKTSEPGDRAAAFDYWAHRPRLRVDRNKPAAGEAPPPGTEPGAAPAAAPASEPAATPTPTPAAAPAPTEKPQGATP
jgi:tetratricopeptide (TPR) repeat protein